MTLPVDSHGKSRFFASFSLRGHSRVRTPYSVHICLEYTRAWPGLVGCLLRLSRLIPVCTSAIVEIVLYRGW